MAASTQHGGYLVPHEMLLEGIAILEDLKTVRAEQVPGVLVDHSEMAIHFRVQRRPVLTDLGVHKDIL